jgi:hypothetical protein
MNLEDIKSNHKLVCLHCGDPITIDNFSGWEAFEEDGITTQPICKFCDLVSESIGEMPKE